jgi:hypothetical protein
MNQANETIIELQKLVELMDEDSGSLDMSQGISDYIAPILQGMLAEIEANRQYVLQTADRANLAILVNEKTFLGEVITSIADHFSTIIEELPENIDPESKLGVAVGEIQDLLATWMSFDMSEDEEDDSEEDDSEENTEEENTEEENTEEEEV